MGIKNFILAVVSVLIVVTMLVSTIPGLQAEVKLIQTRIMDILGFNRNGEPKATRPIGAQAAIPLAFQKCLTCHPEIAEKAKAANQHWPFNAGHCGDCHAPGHPEKGPAQFTVKRSELCSTCHNRQVERTLPYQHYPFKTGKCADCHDHHGSNNSRNLRLPPKVLCNSCHNMALRYLDKKVQHPPFFKSECIACHHPHASANPKNLRAPVDELCNTCHFATLPGQYAMVKHPPFREGKCINCHHPHASDNPRMLRKPIPDLCLMCHRFAQVGYYQKMHPIGEKYPDRALGGKVVCLSCHHPHGTGNPRMWRRPGNWLCFGCHRDKMR